MANKFTHSGNLIIAGFCCMIVAMSFLVYQCTRQQTDMVSTDYYQQELKFQDNIDAKSNAAAYQFKITTSGSNIGVVIPPELAAQMQKASIRFYCPADSRQDKLVPLVAGDGNYTINAVTWKHIRYIAKISLVSNGKVYYKEIPVNL